MLTDGTRPLQEPNSDGTCESMPRFHILHKENDRGAARALLRCLWLLGYSAWFPCAVSLGPSSLTGSGVSGRGILTGLEHVHCIIQPPTL